MKELNPRLRIWRPTCCRCTNPLLARSAGVEPASVRLEAGCLSDRLRAHWRARQELNLQSQGSEPCALSIEPRAQLWRARQELNSDFGFRRPACLRYTTSALKRTTFASAVVWGLGVRPGIEPGLRGPRPRVLPLHHPHQGRRDGARWMWRSSCAHLTSMGRRRKWLTRHPVTVEVAGSIPARPANSQENRQVPSC